MEALVNSRAAVCHGIGLALDFLAELNRCLYIAERIRIRVGPGSGQFCLDLGILTALMDAAGFDC